MNEIFLYYSGKYRKAYTAHIDFQKFAVVTWGHSLRGSNLYTLDNIDLKSFVIKHFGMNKDFRIVPKEEYDMYVILES